MTKVKDQKMLTLALKACTEDKDAEEDLVTHMCIKFGLTKTRREQPEPETVEPTTDPQE